MEGRHVVWYPRQSHMLATTRQWPIWGSLMIRWLRKVASHPWRHAGWPLVTTHCLSDQTPPGTATIPQHRWSLWLAHRDSIVYFVLSVMNEWGSSTADTGKKTLTRTLCTCQQTLIGHILRHEALLWRVTEGKIERKKSRGRPRTMLLGYVMMKNSNRRYGQVKEIIQCREVCHRWVLNLPNGRTSEEEFFCNWGSFCLFCNGWILLQIVSSGAYSQSQLTLLDRNTGVAPEELCKYAILFTLLVGFRIILRILHNFAYFYYNAKKSRNLSLFKHHKKSLVVDHFCRQTCPLTFCLRYHRVSYITAS